MAQLFSLGVMRTVIFSITFLLLTIGCQTQNRHSFVVEDNSPIVGSNRTMTESLGIETVGGAFSPLINAGTKAPCKISVVLCYPQRLKNHRWQDGVIVALFRGTNQLTTADHSLGRVQIMAIPSTTRNTQQVEITLSITQNQILLSARDNLSKDDFEIIPSFR